MEFNNTSDGAGHNATNSLVIETGVKYDNVNYGYGGNLTITGAGTFLKTGTGAIAALYNNYGTRKITFALDAGGVLDVQEGAFVNGGWSQQDWGKNKGTLNLASGTTMNLWDGASVTVDALTGSGTITRGKTRTFTVGAGNHTATKYNEAGTALFTGNFGNGEKTDDNTGLSLTKVGTGTQILAGTNNYDKTNVSAGTLQFGTGGASGNLGTGAVQVAEGAVLALNNTLANTMNSSLSGAGTVSLAENNTLALSGDGAGFSGNVQLVEGASFTHNVAEGSSFGFNGTVNGSGNYVKTGTGTLNLSGGIAVTGTATYEGGKVIFKSAQALGANVLITGDVTAEFQAGALYTETLYTSPEAAHGRVVPGGAYTSATFKAMSANMDDCLNLTTGRGTLSSNNASLSYQNTVWIPNTITVDFAGKYDDTISVFVQKINEDGSTGEWTAALPFGNDCVAQGPKSFTFEAGQYNVDFRAVDYGGSANASGYITTAAGKTLGLGIRYTDAATNSATNNYYALDIDSNGCIAFGDGAILTSNPEKSFSVNSMNIAGGKTFTLSNPDLAAKKMNVTGTFTGGTGTLKIENTSGNTVPLTLSGSTEGNLTLGDGVNVMLSKENDFTIGGNFTQTPGTNYYIDLTGISEDTDWLSFTGAAAGKTTGLDETSKFIFFTSDEVMEPVNITFFKGADETDVNWKSMVDFSNVAGILNFQDIYADADGLHLTVGDVSALPEPAAWLLLLFGTMLYAVRRFMVFA